MSTPTPNTGFQTRRTLVWGLCAAVAIGAVVAWNQLKPQGLPSSISSGNGRLEATDIDVATKSGGRIKAILVKEGDDVQQDQVVAIMDTATLDADLVRAQAQTRQAQQARHTVDALLVQRHQAVSTASALVAQRQAELALAQKQYQRTDELVVKGFLPPQKLDEAQAQLQSVKAGLSAAQSQVAEARAAITAAESQRIEAQSAIETAEASVKRIQADISDATLHAPRSGRVQLRAAQPGEVLGGGGRVLSLVDLSDVYMTFFLPEASAGRVAIGTEARLVLDAAPQFVIPAKVSYVADVAQFTPKTVETTAERQKLVFKVRAQVDPALLAKYRSHVKTGMPGMAYVKTDAAAPWPDKLQVKLPASPAASQP